MKLPKFEYAAPASLGEAISLLSSNPDAKVLAGGQSLMPMMAFRVAQPKMLVDLGNLSELRQIRVENDGVCLGALATWRDILKDQRLAAAHPLLQAAIANVAHYQIRNRGTVGGSMAHADPASEMPCIAQTCEATISVSGPSGERVVAAADFFLGVLTTSLAEDEIITHIKLPFWPAGRRWGFQEFSRRKGDFAIAGVALCYDDVEGRAANARVGVFGMADRSHRVDAAERVLNGAVVTQSTALALAAAVSASVEAQKDIHATAAYRRSLAGTMAERALLDAAAR